MPVAQLLISMFERKKALELMPVRTPGKALLPIPETCQEIEHYVHILLTSEEETVCAIATD